MNYNIKGPNLKHLAIYIRKQRVEFCTFVGNQMELSTHIRHLLKAHNCVIVPNFGGFIANHESAYINKAAATIFPPRKQILFNGNLTQNDGLLASEVGTRTNLDYPKALNFIADCVANWKNQLANGERIDLNEIGFLYKQGDKIIFEQNRETNLLLQSYGFKQIAFISFDLQEKVVAPTVVRAKEFKQPVKQKTTTPIIRLDTSEKVENIADAIEIKKGNVVKLPKDKKKSSRLKYAIAAAAVIPVLFYSYWIPMRTDFLETGKIQYGDFNPFNSSSEKLYATRDSVLLPRNETSWKSWEELTANLPEELKIYSYEFSDELYIPVNLNKESFPVGYDTQAPFHVIAGCFSIKSNAENLVKDLIESGFNAEIIDKNKGLYRVGAGFYSNESDAEKALSQFKSQGKSGWILKR